MNILPMGTNATDKTVPGQAPTQQDTDNMFLKLLTTQLQNQSPLDPVDPNQFAGQLVQFNMLDQLIQINQTLKSATAPIASAQSSTSAVHGAQ